MVTRNLANRITDIGCYSSLGLQEFRSRARGVSCIFCSSPLRVYFERIDDNNFKARQRLNSKPSLWKKRNSSALWRDTGAKMLQNEPCQDRA